MRVWTHTSLLFARSTRNPPRCAAKRASPPGPKRPERPSASPHPPSYAGLVPALFDKRLLFVTGKGGVGKSTAAIVLGLVAARRGLRTVVAELASQERAQRAFERNGSQFREVGLDQNLFTISIDPQHAMEEYLQVKVGALGHALSSSRLFSAFAMATPGMRDLLSIGKVWELAQLERRTRGGSPYDLVIVDAPATGHGLALLRTPATFASIARVGPIAHQAGTIAATIADRQSTGVVAVATAEEMPVNETIGLSQSLLEDGLDLDAVIVNGLYPPRFRDQEMGELTVALGRTRSQLSRSALRAAVSEHARVQTQDAQRERLRTAVNGKLINMPYVFAEQLGREQFDHLAEALAGQLKKPTGARS
jgi:anion-transporting  ArsA/GET3 family ATPase